MCVCVCVLVYVVQYYPQFQASTGTYAPWIMDYWTLFLGLRIKMGALAHIYFFLIPAPFKSLTSLRVYEKHVV